MVAFGSLIGHGQDIIRRGLSMWRCGGRMRMRRSVERTTSFGRHWSLSFVDHIAGRKGGCGGCHRGCTLNERMRHCVVQTQLQWSGFIRHPILLGISANLRQHSASFKKFAPQASTCRRNLKERSCLFAQRLSESQIPTFLCRPLKSYHLQSCIHRGNYSSLSVARHLMV